MKRSLTLVALLLASCGGAELADTPSTSPATPLSTPTTPSTQFVPEDAGGDFYPIQTESDSFGLSSDEMRATFSLASNGCWTASMGFDGDWLVAFPRGSAWGGDHIEVPSGLRVTDGLVAEARGGHIYGIDALAEPWRMLAEFCGMDRLVVFDSIEPAFDPGDETQAQLADRLRAAELTRSWNCGYGFTQSDGAGRVRIWVMVADPSEAPAFDDVTLPDPAWLGRVQVGAHLMANHCDDTFEGWEPEPVLGADWNVVAGTLTFTDVPAGDGPVGAVLSGAVVETDDGLVELPDLQLLNTCWGCFAG